ncbi:MAG: diadenylate cyclase CdaA [Eubacterium sp.]|nr:diadenylate cyclase CdaA [Eubacterium sp.]
MNVVFHTAKNFFEKYFTVPNVYLSDAVEIIVIAILVYYLIIWFRRTRAGVLLRGLLVVLVLMIVASIFHLTTLLWIFEKAINVGIIAMVIIFQPELRRALEELGKKNPIVKILNIGDTYDERFDDRTLDEVLRATNKLSKEKTGALIVMSGDIDLKQYTDTGIKLEAAISNQLLINIFEKNTPLHDGAVVCEGNHIVAATCYLPLSDSRNVPKELGTRHRAALGLSEVSDAAIIVVSEETGNISYAGGGRLKSDIDISRLKSELEVFQDKEVTKKGFFKKGGEASEK